MANNNENANDNSIDLSMLSYQKQIVYLVGYVTRKAINIEPGYAQILQHKIIKDIEFFNKEMLNKIYTNTVKILSKHDAIDEKINYILETISSYMIQALNDKPLGKVEISYYYTLGLTSHELDIVDNKIVYKK